MKRFPTARFSVILFVMAFGPGSLNAALSQGVASLEGTTPERMVRCQNQVIVGQQERHKDLARGPNVGMPQSVD